MAWVPIGAAVRARREARGLTLVELAEKAGVTEKTIWRIEAGLTNSIRPGTLRKIALALDCPMDQLATYVAESPAKRSAPVPETFKDGQGVSAFALAEARRNSGRSPDRSRSEEPVALTAQALENAALAFRVHEGRTYRVTGQVTEQAALTDGERVALGCGRGVGARFLIVAAVGAGETRAVTIYAATTTETRRLQALLGTTPARPPSVLVRLHVVQTGAEHPTLDDDLGPRTSLASQFWAGFSRFGTSGVAPWALVAMTRGTPKPKRGGPAPKGQLVRSRWPGFSKVD